MRLLALFLLVGCGRATVQLVPKIPPVVTSHCICKGTLVIKDELVYPYCDASVCP